MKESLWSVLSDMLTKAAKINRDFPVPFLIFIMLTLGAIPFYDLVYKDDTYLAGHWRTALAFFILAFMLVTMIAAVLGPFFRERAQRKRDAAIGELYKSKALGLDFLIFVNEEKQRPDERYVLDVAVCPTCKERSALIPKAVAGREGVSITCPVCSYVYDFLGNLAGLLEAANAEFKICCIRPLLRRK